jgi:hypothetical protein
MPENATSNISEHDFGDVEMIKNLTTRIENLELERCVVKIHSDEIKTGHDDVFFCLTASTKQASVAASRAFEATRLARTMARNSMLAAAKANQHKAYEAVKFAVISTKFSSLCATASASAAAAAAAAVANALVHQVEKGTISLVIESLEFARLASGMALESSLLANAAQELNRNLSSGEQIFVHALT